MLRLLYLCIVCCLLAFSACRNQTAQPVSPEMATYETFFATHADSISLAPRWLRDEARQRMETTEDSLVRYCYLGMTLKTYLMTAQYDSAWILIRQIEDFVSRQSSSPQRADLYSDCLNMAGNI